MQVFLYILSPNLPPLFEEHVGVYFMYAEYMYAVSSAPPPYHQPHPFHTAHPCGSHAVHTSFRPISLCRFPVLSFIIPLFFTPAMPVDVINTGRGTHWEILEILRVWKSGSRRPGRCEAAYFECSIHRILFIWTCIPPHMIAAVRFDSTLWCLSLAVFPLVSFPGCLSPAVFPFLSSS